MSKFSYDEDWGALVKRLDDGRVLRVRQQLYNTILTLSSSAEDPGWHDGW